MPDNYFSLWRSFAYLISAFVLAYFLWSPYFDQAPEDGLESPAGTLFLISESDLAFYDALEMSSPTTRRVQRFFWGSEEDLYDSYIDTYSGFYTWQKDLGVDTLNIQMRLAILYAEQGDRAAATAELAAVSYSSDADAIISVFGYSYGFIDKEPSDSDVQDLDTLLGTGWFLSHVKLRLAERRGDQVAFQTEQQILQQRATSSLNRSNRYLFISYSPVVIGLLLLVWFVVRKKDLPAPLLSQGQAAWSIREGAALWTRSEFLVMLYWILVLEYFWWVPVMWQWGSLLAALPGFWLIHRYLLLPKGLNFMSAWGLSPARFGWSRLAIWTLVIIAISSLGSFFIQTILMNFEFEVPWTEGISETLFWGDSYHISMELVDTIIWAPIAEEIIFRGIIYIALRNIFSPIPAALLTGLLFASLHFYSLPGMLDLLWLSLVWALAYERCKSLLPIMLAHSFNNINWAAFWMITY